jgi:hypothetical protein
LSNAECKARAKAAQDDAERLIRHLGRASFVLMRSEHDPAPTTAIMLSSPG